MNGKNEQCTLSESLLLRRFIRKLSSSFSFCAKKYEPFRSREGHPTFPPPKNSFGRDAHVRVRSFKGRTGTF